MENNEYMVNEYMVIVLETITGDERPVYVGKDRDQALKIYNNNRNEPDVEVEFYTNNELRFWHQN